MDLTETGSAHTYTQHRHECMHTQRDTQNGQLKLSTEECGEDRGFVAFIIDGVFRAFLNAVVNAVMAWCFRERMKPCSWITGNR